MTLRHTIRISAIIGGLFASLVCLRASSIVTINSDLVLVINGEKVFPIGFTMPPPPDGQTPEGKNGIAELAEAGATFLRTGAGSNGWEAATIERETKYLDAAEHNGMHCMPYLKEYARIGNVKREAELRELLNRFKDHPGLGVWKGEDEPEWGKVKLAPLLKAYTTIKEVDPGHPVVLIQAPRGTVESLRSYNVAADIIGTDIYPISYPPGTHSILTNNQDISLVGDHTRIMTNVAGGVKPVWMVLQISWSGVLKTNKTLRFPTFPEERFMTYDAIINGARGLFYFGGNNEKAMTETDRKVGWNWTFWKRVLRPVVEEIGSKSSLYPALVAAESKLAITVNAGSGVEYCVRETGGELFVIAAKRAGGTEKVTFSGLPVKAGVGELLYEAPRTVEAVNGTFTDWFAPFEVHVYRFRLEASQLK